MIRFTNALRIASSKLPGEIGEVITRPTFAVLQPDPKDKQHFVLLTDQAIQVDDQNIIYDICLVKDTSKFREMYSYNIAEDYLDFFVALYNRLVDNQDDMGKIETDLGDPIQTTGLSWDEQFSYKYI